MKYTLVRATGMLLLGSLTSLLGGTANAGWGSLGGSGGGSSGGSSGYTASYGGSAMLGSSGGSSGMSAAYASYGSSGGAGSSGGDARPGLLHRVAGRIHDHMHAKRARHAARRAAYGSSGGMSSGGSSGGYSSYSAYGSSGGSSGQAVSYGSTGAGYGSTGAGYGSVGGYYGASTATSSATSSLVSNVQTHADAVYLTVTVPGNAKLFVNGNPTTSTGAVRQFVSRGLKPGKSYKFEVTAELQGADGQTMTEAKSIAVTSGQREHLQFAFAENPSTIETAVVLNLPENAQVLLAGKPTKATGAQRTFRTSHLKPGQVWDDYEIEVKLGDEVKRQVVRLIAGDNLQLSFNFDDDSQSRIAAR